MMWIAKTGFAAVLSAFALTAIALPASASLIGTTVDITSPHGDCSGITVGAGVECRINDNPFADNNAIDVDIQDARIVFDFLDIGGAPGFFWASIPFVFDVVVSGLTWVDNPSAAIASIVVTTELFGIDGGAGDPNTIGAVQSGANQVTLNFGDLHRLNCVATLCARLTVDITPEHSDLPEPASLALFGFGLLGVGAALRRRRALA